MLSVVLLKHYLHWVGPQRPGKIENTDGLLNSSPTPTQIHRTIFQLAQTQNGDRFHVIFVLGIMMLQNTNV